MRRNALFFTLFAIGLALVSTAALSEPRGFPPDHHHERPYGRHDGRGEHHHHDYGHFHERGRDGHSSRHAHRAPHRMRPPVRQDNHAWHDPRRIRPAHRFHRERPLPRTYHHHHYVVHHRHLHRPPRGHHWVRVDGEYLLVAIATGIIVDILVTR